MDLEKVIQEKTDLLVSNGTVEKMIETYLTKCIDSALNDLLRDYSDFGRQVKAAIGKKLEISLDRLNISAYTTMVCNTIESTLNGSSLESSIEKVKKHTSAILEQIEKKEWKLSEIAIKLMERYHSSENNDRPIMEVTHHDWGSKIIRLYQGKKGRSYNDEYEISVNAKDSKVYYITSNGNPLDPTTEPTHGLRSFIMQLWANECIIEINEDEAQEVIEYWGEG